MTAAPIIRRLAAVLLTGAVVLGAGPVAGAFDAGTLRGVQRVQVTVDGIPRDFERYGLTARQVRRNAEDRLNAYGIEVIDAATALSDKSASQITIRLHANHDTYANYSYRVALLLKRKLPLDASGQSFVSKVVWSQGRSGLLNPSDLPRIYGDVDLILDQFITDHGSDNPGAQTALDKEHL